MTTYRFMRTQIDNAAVITAKLNEVAKEGWRVVSHSEAGGEYSFVLSKEDGR